MPEPFEPEHQPGSITRQQVTRIIILCHRRGLDDRGDRLAELSNITGRQVGTANDLSYMEALAVIQSLESAVSHA